MPGSMTTPGQTGARDGAPAHIAFRYPNGVGAREHKPFAAPWPACTLPCRRFAPHLAVRHARLGAGVDRYSFTVRDLHPLLLRRSPGALGSFLEKSGVPLAALLRGFSVHTGGAAPEELRAGPQRLCTHLGGHSLSLEWDGGRYELAYGDRAASL